MNSADERPNFRSDRPREKGVPDLSDLMNQKKEIQEEQQPLDLSSLMNEIRRVPTSGAPKQIAPSAPKEAPRPQAPAVPKGTPKTASANVINSEMKSQTPAAQKETPKAPAAHVAPATAREMQKRASEPARRPSDSAHTPARRAAASSQARRIRDQRLAAKRRRVSIILATTLILLVVAIGMGIFYAITHWPSKSKNSSASSTSVTTTTLPSTSQTTTTSEQTESTSTETTAPEATPTPSVTPFPAGGPSLTGYCVVIDPGHQAVANTDPEVMSSSMGGSKDKSAQGYVGVSTGTDESEINLQTALLLREYLESLGCEVYLTRETNDVDISNKERAEFAVSHKPDVFIRLYCNAANDSKTSGCEVIVPSSGTYASSLQAWGEKLGKAFETHTGSAFNGCKASGNYSGLNWANSVPSFMIRMGYLSNSDDEAKLLDAEYQYKECQAIAEFISTMAKN
ncbi:MAG: N-acetylmuramoyl-L-alanine amidase [Clostridiales bacterium]|nr:N-acetylmuramoyl-L-alanine amidase [Clostridiales bacterium]